MNYLPFKEVSPTKKKKLKIENVAFIHLKYSTDKRNQCTISGNKGEAYSASLTYCSILTPHTAGVMQTPTSSTREPGKGQFNTKNKWTIVRCAASDYPEDEDLRTQRPRYFISKKPNSPILCMESKVGTESLLSESLKEN